ncbi:MULTISPECIES: GTP 3',8-cyclase MoaA [Actinomyces]|uniref:GTP 3',8-cyclase MoaA n=1 Tax=Actinomyces TaxID=1654 RepID=UPI00021D1308|nr:MULTISPECIES: GTP 3',8-cyclase MoaA [Actinomyces]EGV12632.1 molybdenum cofactor biosynthesis protein A [Actinomyces sp. oral taxon 175 str. F0384]PKY86227.1 GTP 3',8-cyclase MoaA [Actinomyces naeslundii]
MTPAPLDAAVVGPSRSRGASADLPMPTTRPVLPDLPERPGLSAPAADGVPQQLVDRYGRTVRDLRLSITDRCNLRCTYCMPAQGLQWLPTPDLLTTAELTRLGRIAVERLGVERIRLTGGEPLMRRDLEEIVGALSALRTSAGAKPDIALTTNGLGLEKRAAGLRAAGLDRVNISIDSLDPQDYAAITRRDRLADVLTGIAGAQEAGLDPIKVNAVAVPATVEERAPRLLAECLRRGWQLRFIEHMPLGPRETWSSQDVVGVDQILEVLREAGFTLTEVGRPDRRPAALWRVAAGSASGQEHPAGTVGVIASVTAPFCSDCDRTRITADGRLMTCLFSSTETDLRGPMRAGADDDELIRIWAGATWGKPRAHGSDSPHTESDGFARPQRTMSAIGG